MKDLGNEILKAYVRGIFNQYQECAQDTERLQEICAEQGIAYIDHNNCDGFCPDCGQMSTCEAYEEIREEWDGFYS